MRKYIRILAIVALALTGCDKYLTDELPEFDLVDGNVIRDQKSAEVALNGIYQPLESEGTFTAQGISWASHALGLTEETWMGIEDDLVNNSISTEDRNSYVRPYGIINNANLVIKTIEGVDESKFEEGRKESIIAEAKFLRFWGHYWILKWYSQHWDTLSKYGNVMRREPATGNNINISRLSVSETYINLLEDLDYTIKNGPDFKSIYTVHKDLAKAYKAEILLMRGIEADLDEVINLCNDLIGNWTLETTYEDVFSNGYNSTELMFSRYMDEDVIRFAGYNVASIFNLFSGVYVATDFYKDLLTDDARFDKVLKFKETNDDGIDLYVIGKLLDDENTNLPNYYMRLAQVYLMKAEAMARSGASIEDCLEAINVLRLRSANTTIDANDVVNRQMLMDIIFEEILLEMGCENGYEYSAGLRFMRNGKPRIHDIKGDFENTNYILMIPMDELEFNIYSDQNPGYTK